MGYFWVGVGFKNYFEVSSYRLILLFSEFSLSYSFEFLWLVVVVGGGGGECFVSTNPTTVMAVFMLGLWLLLGCDNSPC